MNILVNEFVAKAKKWQAEIELLRSILMECGLIEEFKWKQPCYVYNKKNIIIIACFKDSIALSFLKGVLLQDELNILTLPGENSQSVRLVKFNNISKIKELKAEIKSYIFEAIENEKAGIKISKPLSTNLVLVPELQQALANNVKLQKAFYALTTGRQRAYNLYFSKPKQVQSRLNIIEKYKPRILSGKGFHDCVCGMSKKMPNCDGSHKYLQ
jgi:uncharacterized protein YdeI (YjbR/CyaY-like superfamily)